MKKRDFFVSPKRDMEMAATGVSTRLLAGCNSLNIRTVSMLFERIKQKDDKLFRMFGGESRKEIASLFKEWDIPVTNELELSTKKEYIILEQQYSPN